MKTEWRVARWPCGWRQIKIQAAEGQLLVSLRPSWLAEGVCPELTPS